MSNPVAPNYNHQTERALLGSLLIDQDAILKIAGILRPEHFDKLKHQTIYEAILAVYERQEPVDLVTLQTELQNRNKLSEVGGVSELTVFYQETFTSANAETYARSIKDLYIKRQLVQAGHQIQQIVEKEPDTETIVKAVESIIFKSIKDRTNRDFVQVKDVVVENFENLEQLSKTQGAVQGVPTGIPSLDRMLNGLRKEDLILLAARPSVGKSSFAVNIAQHASLHGHGVAFFSLEMGKNAIVDRMLSAQADIDGWRLVSANLTTEEFERYTDAAGELSEIPMYIDDTPGISIMELRTKAKKLSMEHKIELIIVDYLQLITGPRYDSRVREVSDISQALKNLARELKVPVMALSQLSRDVEKRGKDKRPMLSDLRDSGSLEQDADVVMFLHKPDENQKTTYKLLIEKHRNGPVGDLDLYFKPDRTRFFSTANFGGTP